MRIHPIGYGFGIILLASAPALRAGTFTSDAGAHAVATVQIGPIGQVVQDRDDHTESPQSTTLAPAVVSYSQSVSKSAVFNAFDAPSNTNYMYTAAATSNQHVEVSAEPLLLHLATNGQMGTATSAITPNSDQLIRQASAVATIGMSASWDDNLTLHVPGVLSNSKAYIIHGSLLFDGSIHADFTGGSGSANYDVFLQDINVGLPESPLGFSKWGTYSLDADGTEIDRPVPHVIQTTIIISNDVSSEIGFTMLISGITSIAVGPGNVDGIADFSVDYGHTMRWGGIDEIDDGQTGLPITDYSLTADSGADYLHAAVPEPASTVTAIAGGVIFGLRRPRRH